MRQIWPSGVRQHGRSLGSDVFKPPIFKVAPLSSELLHRPPVGRPPIRLDHPLDIGLVLQEVVDKTAAGKGTVNLDELGGSRLVGDLRQHGVDSVGEGLDQEAVLFVIPAEYFVHILRGDVQKVWRLHCSCDVDVIKAGAQLAFTASQEPPRPLDALSLALGVRHEDAYISIRDIYTLVEGLACDQNADVAAKVSESKDAPTQNEEFNTELAQVTEVANRGYGNFLNPLAIYLSGIGFARDNNYENAIVDFERLYKALPNHPLIRSSYVAVLQRTGREIPEELKSVKALEHPLDQNSLLVIFANGRSAAFKQIAVYFPVMTAWPICEYYDAPYRTLGVETDGVKNETVPLADMDGILSQEYKERLTAMIIRITISTTLKEAASYGAAYAAWRANPIVGVAVFLSSVVYRATFNTADTRSWEILPKEFQIAQLPMPENRELKLTLSPNGSSLPLETTLLLPDTCRSAILYVDAPGPGVWNCKVLELKAK